MKKTIIFTLLLATIPIGGYIGSRNLHSSANALTELYTDNCEALADCEVYDSNHNLIARCSGSSGVCYEITSTLYCSGKSTK